MKLSLKHKTYRFLLPVLLSGLLSSQSAFASREFLMSCAYGAMAGTLVGAASLAFTDKPGENLSHIARGASLGLYAGILLGLYVVYGVPSEEEQALRNQTQAYQPPRVWVTPVLEQNKPVGAFTSAQILSF